MVLDIPEFRQWRRPFELDLLEEQRISEEARRQSLAARQEAAAAAVEAPSELGGHTPPFSGVPHVTGGTAVEPLPGRVDGGGPSTRHSGTSSDQEQRLAEAVFGDAPAEQTGGTSPEQALDTRDAAVSVAARETLRRRKAKRERKKLQWKADWAAAKKRLIEEGIVAGGVEAAGAAPSARSVALLLLQKVAPPLLLVEGLTVLPAEGLQLAEALLAGAWAPAETPAALLTRPPLLLAGGWAALLLLAWLLLVAGERTSPEAKPLLPAEALALALAPPQTRFCGTEIASSRSVQVVRVIRSAM
ncbi:hypothetical protein APUTEX25_002984 [Auxenochlorella protothecoides]|uniref:Uncharacterized protein n=1 Tax=Auxenochlorella protothecoides TaxID=3075 RepID=A0A3M7L4F0_AUXPR|nr:hypothetical protein APUTEX25_002984 [Auxenochlorella protothecoides]|eukprot:RMZ56895.1 hypothetical protein APUTEX25_002984 [Auxenochlorella protothecoides]